MYQMLQKSEMHLQLKPYMMKERAIWVKVGTFSSYMHTCTCTNKTRLTLPWDLQCQRVLTEYPLRWLHCVSNSFFFRWHICCFQIFTADVNHHVLPFVTGVFLANQVLQSKWQNMQFVNVFKKYALFLICWPIVFQCIPKCIWPLQNHKSNHSFLICYC